MRVRRGHIGRDETQASYRGRTGLSQAGDRPYVKCRTYIQDEVTLEDKIQECAKRTTAFLGI